MKVAIAESHYLYLGLLLFTALFPLAFGFEKRLKYFRSFPKLMISILVMMAIFIPWDVWFTVEEVWWFNAHYTSGLTFMRLPVEEWLFFIIIPLACLFIYEALNYYFPNGPSAKLSTQLSITLIGTLIIIAMTYHDRLYTMINFMFAAILLLLFTIHKPAWMGNFYRMYLVSLIPFTLVNGALTGLFTAGAVVNYDPGEIIGLRILTIPVEDCIYNLSMLLMVTWLYEWLKSIGSSRK